jgi:hypothetical protein
MELHFSPLTWTPPPPQHQHMNRSKLSFPFRSSWKARYGRWLMLSSAERDRAIRLRSYEMIPYLHAVHRNAKTVVQPVKLSIVNLITLLTLSIGIHFIPFTLKHTSNRFRCCKSSITCITITVLDIIHRPVVYLKHDVSRTRFYRSTSGEAYSGGPSRKKIISMCTSNNLPFPNGPTSVGSIWRRRQNPVSETSSFK